MTVREARLSKNLSTRDAANLAGMEPIKWNQIERGNTDPSPADKLKIIRAVGKCDFASSEEVAATRQKLEEAFAHMIEARSRILLAAGGARGVQGSVKCPACDTGHLRFSIAGVNGHVHAACSTSGCLSWME